jgi:peptidoglycan/LPS O-acetylase OafA/YrhL
MQWYWFGFTELHIPAISVEIMTPLSVLFAWLFYRLFERPFMSTSIGMGAQRRQSSLPQTPTESVSDPLSV